MGLVDLIRKQFIDVIDWTEDQPGTLAFRYPMQDREIQNGAMLTVRESQRAAFINEGKLADSFGPGLYRLTTQTLPVLTSLRNWDKLFQSPFKSDVYFFSQREQLDRKWGTAQPITIRDREFGPLRVRAHGTYSWLIEDIEPFWKRLAGTQERFTVDDMDGQLRAMVVTQMAAFLGRGEIAFIDMAANQAQLSAQIAAALAQPFRDYGLQLRSFFVESLSLPEEVQQHLDRAGSMRVVGDLRSYTQFQAADAIAVAAANPGGTAGIGAGLGAGVAIGQSMGQSMAEALSGTRAATAPDALATIERLHELVGKGVLTQAEFESKKAELLRSIR